MNEQLSTPGHKFKFNRQEFLLAYRPPTPLEQMQGMAVELLNEALFGHLADDEFTAAEASEYLAVSLSTFLRLLASGKLQPRSTVGRSQVFAVPVLKAFKKAWRATKGQAAIARPATEANRRETSVFATLAGAQDGALKKGPILRLTAKTL